LFNLSEKPSTFSGEVHPAKAVEIDQAVKDTRSDVWRGHQPRENEIKRALFALLNQNKDEVDRIFLIICNQSEY
jgi:type I restriction enzyme, R subunit